MRNAVEAIFEELSQNEQAMTIAGGIEREILKNFKKRDMEKLLLKLLSLRS